jgi:uncharacterized spore protein YtfJ
MVEQTPDHPPGVIERVGERLADNLTTIFGDVATSQIFETLERTDDRVVIGASTLERAGGFGFGGGEGVDAAGSNGGGGGGGGGGAGQARPIAVIEVTSGGVKIWPVLDYTKLGLVAVGVLAAIWKARR